MKILHLIYSMERGGAEMDLLAKARILAGEGVEQHIAVMVKRGPLADPAEEAGIQIHELGMTGKTDLSAVVRLRSLIGRIQPHILHTHLFNAGLLGRLASGLASRMAVISTVQAIRPERSSWQVRADHYLAHATYKVIASSKATQRYLIEEGLPPGKVAAIHNCVDFSRFEGERDRMKLRGELGIPAEAPVVGCVSRLDPDKDLPTLIDAFRFVKQERPEARLVIVGGGRERAMLEGRIHQLKMDDSVHLAGERSDIPDCLAAFDLFALSSITESFGIVLVEALAMGLPVVATNVGGIPEIIDEGETGRLVFPWQPDAMAGAIAEILSNPEEARAMAREGSRRVRERFSAERLARRQHALYTRAIKRLEKNRA